IAYMSPEQIRAEKVDHRTDIWSFGVVLYEMLTGRLPFRGEHQAAMVYSITNEEPQPLGLHPAEATDDLQRVIKRLLEKNISQRYQSVEEIIQDLRQAGARPQTPAKEKRSLAVLPFDNISPEKETEYFSDGLTEEIIATLSKLPGLKVISRTSIMQYKEAKKPLRQIAGELQVQYILEGSVRKQGNDLRITAQLIDATRDEHLWAEKYRGTMDDVFEIQENVAIQIAEALKLQLSPGEQQRLKRKYAENAEAYQLYLRGRFYWNQWTPEGYRKARECYHQAIRLDQHYALAYAGLADTYASLASGDAIGISPKEALPRAREAALKALELDDSLSEAHVSLAVIMLFYEWNWKKSEEEFQRAIELKPSSANAHHWFSHLLLPLGQQEKSLATSLRALELDPLDIEMSVHLAWHYIHSYQYDKAVEQCTKAREKDPKFHETYWFLGLALEQQGRFDEAIAAFQKASQLSERSAIYQAALAHVLALVGKMEEAERMIEELKARSKERYVSAFHFAVFYTGIGDKQRAIEYLEQAYQERSSWMPYIGIDPRLRRLHPEPRFTELVRKMGLAFT
ncbi:MAG: tetratricopeptide repeat protein, partial [Bacteroidota bacterium]